MTQIKKAVIPAAGFGTRFLPFTKAIPKEMLPIVDKPVIQILAEEAAQSGIEQIILITGRGKRAIEDHFDSSFELEHLLTQKNKEELLWQIKKVENLVKFIFVRQPRPKGDGDAILCAEEVVGSEPFAVVFGDDLIYGDTPALKQVLDVYNQRQSSVIGLQKVASELVSRFGIVEPLEEGDEFPIGQMIEKPRPEEAPSNLAIIGKFVCTNQIFKALRHTEASVGGELRLIDGFIELAKSEAIFGKIVQGDRFDTGDKLGFLQAVVTEALKRPDLSPDFLDFLKRQTANL
jgi:UTP--glucose-1-phosphate uridylyltransferase